MIGKAFILLLCIVAGLAMDIKSICASQTSNQLWPHKKNCNQFYQCDNRIPVAQTCAPGTNFNENIQVCDWPANVNCNRTVIYEEEINYEEEAATKCTEESSEGFQLPHRNCSRFYKCSHGIPYPLDCPANLLYNINLQVCDWPEVVTCGNRIPPNKIDQNTPSPATNSEENSVDPKKVCATKGSEGVLLPHEKCNYFYECANGVPIVLVCPDGLLFDNKKEQCEWAEDVKCSARKPPSTQTVAVPNGAKDFESIAVKACSEEGSNGLLLPHENCNKFYECAQSVPVAFDCYPGLLFSIEANRCDWIVDCGDRKPPNATTVPAKGNKEKDESKDLHSDAIAACAAEDSEGLLLAHENCNQFYECAHGRPVTLECQEGLLYNIVAKRCDWAGNVDCGERNPHSKAPKVEPKKNKNFELSAIEACAVSSSESLLLPHDNCYEFYECAQGVPVVFDCYPGLVFNAETNQCDWQEHVDCGNRKPTPSQDFSGKPKGERVNGIKNDQNTNAGDVCVLDDSNGVLLPHVICNKFYECAQGQAVTLECPAGLLYNVTTQRCDWAADVECGDRARPQNNRFSYDSFYFNQQERIEVY